MATQMDVSPVTRGVEPKARRSVKTSRVSNVKVIDVWRNDEGTIMEENFKRCQFSGRRVEEKLRARFGTITVDQARPNIQDSSPDRLMTSTRDRDVDSEKSTVLPVCVMTKVSVRDADGLTFTGMSPACRHTILRAAIKVPAPDRMIGNDSVSRVTVRFKRFMSQCLTVLRLSFGTGSPSRLAQQQPIKRIDLPTELWLAIFDLLDASTFVSLSRVNRHFNALAVPLYLAQHGTSAADLAAGRLRISSSIIPVLHTAFFLPHIKDITGTVYGLDRVHVLRYLRLLLTRQTFIDQIQLKFNYIPDDYSLQWKFMQGKICDLLNGILSARKALVAVGGRMLFVSGPQNDTPWSVVPQAVAPPPGIRGIIARLFKERQPANLDVIFVGRGDINGTTIRDNYKLPYLDTLDVVYPPSRAWTVVVLNKFQFSRLSLHPALTAADWACVLPLLDLPSLRELSMGSQTYTTSCIELLDVAMADLHAFLTRHASINYLQYTPQLPSAPLTPPGFSLTSFRRLTHLTTTPAHLLILRHVPDIILMSLFVLRLLPPASIPADTVKRDFMAVLRLLATPAESSDVRSSTLCLHFPAAWITPPPAGLAIECVKRLLIWGCEGALDVRALAAFVVPFAAGSMRVDLYDVQGQALREALREAVPWLESARCHSYYSN
ncbi:hypothetical protein GGX14DRAFT_408639 [Mycena pura]|uniref:F-box domain-containing protein n=1 Tax=Mycena pura TaxID=153505 RepID=A0AAD6XXK5_9AGAR|nr:hypothetical protein GGX14DRAFT_408639 [Mycena pura]